MGVYKNKNYIKKATYSVMNRYNRSNGGDDNQYQYPQRNTLFFAGEAGSIYPGFVHGAYLSGLQTARQILACEGRSHDADGEICPPAYQPPNGTNHTKKCDAEEGAKDNSDLEERLEVFLWLFVSVAIVLCVLVSFLGVKYICASGGRGRSRRDLNFIPNLDSKSERWQQDYGHGRAKGSPSTPTSSSSPTKKGNKGMGSAGEQKDYNSVAISIPMQPSRS